MRRSRAQRLLESLTRPMRLSQRARSVFLGEPHLIHPIRTEEPYLRIRGINYPWLSSLSH